MSTGPHYLKITCKDCGKFIKWGKKPEKQDIQKTNNYTGGHEAMNVIILIGRLTKDPELRYTGNNIAVTGFTLAVDRRFKQDNGPDADFFPIVAWQKTAEFCSKYFKKGLRVSVKGSLQNRTWEDTEGNKHYVTEVVADEVGFADGEKDSDAGGSQNDQKKPSGAQHNQGQAPGGQNNGQAAEGTKKTTFPWERGEA